MRLRIQHELLKYTLVGLAANVMLYGGYLMLTTFGIGPKIAMTVLYPIGLVQTYIVNKAWTFQYRGRLLASMSRYVTTYVAGYLLNFSALALLVDLLAYPHAIVQAAMVFVVALFIFLMQKYWVFATDREASVAA